MNWDWLKRWLTDEYEVTVWFKPGSGMLNGDTKKIFKFKRIDKLTNKHIKGVTTDNEKFEIRTIQPFDYNVRKLL